VPCGLRGGHIVNWPMARETVRAICDSSGLPLWNRPDWHPGQRLIRQVFEVWVVKEMTSRRPMTSVNDSMSFDMPSASCFCKNEKKKDNNYVAHGCGTPQTPP
jgi:hypothetical protein